MKYIKINKFNLLFMVLLLLPERMFFLLDQNKFQNLFHINYYDFVMIVYLLLAVFAFLHFKTSSFERYYFNNSIVFIIPLVIMASVVPYFLFNQTIQAGFWIQKNFFLLIFVYYFFRTLIVENVISTEYLWNCIYKLSFAITGVILIQHTISNYVRFLSVEFSSRFGVRITANYTYSTILLIGSLTLFFMPSCKKDKILSAIGLMMAYYHCIFVSQTRIVMVAYGVMTIIMALFFNNRVLKKVTYIFVIVGLILIILQSELGQYLLSALFDSSTDASAQIREIGKALYIYEISKTPLVGRGYPNSIDAMSAAGLLDQIALNDNGIYGFAYIYGFIGLMWFVWLIVKMLVCSIKAVKKQDFRFILFTVFLLVICPNIVWWYWKFSFGIIFAFMLVMMEEYHKNISEPKIRLYLR